MPQVAVRPIGFNARGRNGWFDARKIEVKGTASERIFIDVTSERGTPPTYAPISLSLNLDEAAELAAVILNEVARVR